jgi:hypothetical protein
LTTTESRFPLSDVIREIARRATRAADRVAGTPKKDRPLLRLRELALLRGEVEAAIRSEIRALRAEGIPTTRIAEAALLTRQAVNRQLRLARQRTEEAGDGTD